MLLCKRAVLAYIGRYFNFGDTFSYAEGHGDDAVGTGYSIQTADEVRQVVQNTQIMLYNNYVSKRGQRDALRWFEEEA